MYTLFSTSPATVLPRPINACSVGEWADKEHGVFSYYLLQGLRRQANDKGQVTITDLANYIQQQVVDWARTYRGKQQIPWLNLQGSANLVLTGTFLFVAARSRLCLRIG